MNPFQNNESGPPVRHLERLPEAPLNPAAVQMLSHFCSRTWQVCPVDFHHDNKRFILTLAVHKTQQIQVMYKRFDFLLQPNELSFVLCSRDEVMRAIEAFYTAANPRELSQNGPGTDPLRQASPESGDSASSRIT